MSLSSISHGAGPGSAMPLSAETIKVRDKVIERFIDKSLDELTTFLENALQVEKDEDRRLGLLAARIYILRHRVEHIKEYNRDPSVEPMGLPTPRSLLNQPDQTNQASGAEPDSPDATAPTNLKEVKTIEAGEINGVRIPAGINIMVNDEDAERMIANGKAIYIVKDENGNIIPQPDQPAAETDSQPPASDQPVLETSEQDTQSEEYVSGDTASGDTASGAGAADNAEAEDISASAQPDSLPSTAETEEAAAPPEMEQAAPSQTDIQTPESDDVASADAAEDTAEAAAEDATEAAAEDAAEDAADDIQADSQKDGG